MTENEALSNVPPTDVNPLLDRLRETHAPLLSLRDELMGRIESQPSVIEDEDTAGRMADFVDEINKFIKRAGAVHQDEKAPFLQAGRTVDSFKHTLIDEIEKGKTKVNTTREVFAKKKADEERRIREEAERKAREEQRRLEQEAAAKAAALREEQDLEAALRAEDAAEKAKRIADKAAKAAAAKPAELGKSRGEHGGQTTLKQFWNKGDIDRAAIDLEALRQHLSSDALDKAVNSWINANKDALKDGATLKGVRIFEDTRL